MKAFILALVIVQLPFSGRAQAPPEPAAEEGAEPAGPPIYDSTWRLEWSLDGHAAYMAFTLGSDPVSYLMTELHKGHSTSYNSLLFLGLKTHSITEAGGQVSSWLAEIVDDDHCGRARVTLRKDPSGMDVDPGPRRTPSRPSCGELMVETVEWHEPLTTLTCVDGPFIDPPHHAQLVLVLDERGRPLLATSEVPDALLGLPVPDYLPRGLPWRVSMDCQHTLFERTYSVQIAPPRESIALSYAWGDEPVDLVWIETWTDFRQTGEFFAFYPNGQAMTFGVQVDGLPHGVWWYLAPDGTLAEARLYALGVELERLPVETVIEPYYVVRTPGNDPRPPLTP